MSRYSGRRWPRLYSLVGVTATALMLAVTASGCVPGTSTTLAAKQPSLPASARIVRTAEIAFPPEAVPPSKRPNAGQRSVVFVDARTGFLAGGGQPAGTDSGGVYQAEAAGVERNDGGGQAWAAARGDPRAL